MKLNLTVLLCLLGQVLFGQISITRSNWSFPSIIGSSYYLLSATNVTGPWNTNQLATATSAVIKVAYSPTNKQEFFRYRRVAPEIIINSDLYVERVVTIDLSLPINSGWWQVNVRTNGPIGPTFLTWSGPITTNRIRLQDFGVYGYTNAANGFDVETWVTNSSVRVTNTFHMANNYRPLIPKYQSSIVEQGGVITGDATGRTNADVALLGALESLAGYWRFFDVQTDTAYQNPTNWSVLTSPSEEQTLRNYLAGTLTNKPSHLFYLGTNASFAISNKITFAMFVGTNASALATAAAGPVKTWEELDAEGKYGRFAVWIDTPIQGTDISDRLSDAITRFLGLASEGFPGGRVRTCGQALAKVIVDFPEFTWNFRGSLDADLDGYY